MEVYYSIMCRYFWIGFADFMLKVKNFLNFLAINLDRQI